MKFKVSYSITGTFEIDVPDEEVTGMAPVIALAAEVLKDSAFQAGVIFEGQHKKVSVTGVEPVRED